MNNIKLKVGGRYLTRCGIIIKITFSDNKGEMPFYGEIESAENLTATIFYTQNGVANPYARQSDPYNIVAEIDNPLQNDPA
jgi:hypothetical protein